MTAKPCLGCGRLLATAAETCGFCGTDQPAAAAALAKEARCATCRRPYSAKLRECPFCERDRAAGIAPTAFGRTASLKPPVFEPETTSDDGPPSWLATALVFAVPLGVAAAWGVWQATQTAIIGDARPWRAAGVLAVLTAPLVGVAFVRRRYLTLEAAIDELGGAKAFLVGALVAVVALVPTALGFFGAIGAINTAGLDAREESIACTVGSIWHRTRADKDLGWQMSYWCDVRGEHLTDSLERLPARPDLVEGGIVHVRAARGRLGYWIRLGEPTNTVTTSATP